MHWYTWCLCQRSAFLSSVSKRLLGYWTDSEANRVEHCVGQHKGSISKETYFSFLNISCQSEETVTSLHSCWPANCDVALNDGWKHPRMLAMFCRNAALVNISSLVTETSLHSHRHGQQWNPGRFSSYAWHAFQIFLSSLFINKKPSHSFRKTHTHCPSVKQGHTHCNCVLVFSLNKTTAVIHQTPDYGTVGRRCSHADLFQQIWVRCTKMKHMKISSCFVFICI